MKNFKVKAHRTIQPEPDQRILFCGDVHGDMKALKRALNKVDYLEGQDMLIFVGDLIDRGSHSMEVVKFACTTPHVYSTLGNHESMFLAGFDDELVRQIHIKPNIGGYWIEDYSEEELRNLAELIVSTMTISLTIQTKSHRVGVIHAQSPENWADVLNPSSGQIEDSLWSIQQFNNALVGRKRFVKGIDVVIHGHVSNYKTVSGNQIWIDTLYHSGSLTILSLDEILKML
jgi:predicted phosphodiesterase